VKFSVFSVGFVVFALSIVTVSGTAKCAEPGERKESAEREQVGEVFGVPVYRDQIKLDNSGSIATALHRLFLQRVAQAYGKKHRTKVELSAKELDAAMRYYRELFEERYRSDRKRRLGFLKPLGKLEQIVEQLAASGLSAARRKEIEQQRERVESRITEKVRFFSLWSGNRLKLQQHLFRKYGGGRVLWQQLGSEAFDAKYKWLQEQERLGHFRIDDPQLRATFYKYWTSTTGIFANPDAHDGDAGNVLTFPWIERPVEAKKPRLNS
jgi:hypothetical protein